MTDQGDLFQSAIDAALNGENVDWGRIKDLVQDPADLATLENVRRILGIAEFYRAELQPASAGGSTLADGLDQTDSRVSWGSPRGLAAGERRPPETWGRLEIKRQIGIGGYGTVFLAWDPKLHREVALKLLERPEPVPGRSVQAALDALLLEARMIAQVKHPNVVVIYDADENDGIPGIWMEYIPGKTLHQIMQEKGPLDWRQVAQFSLALCDAVGAVHSRHKIHRDITAKNLMIEDGGRVVLMDFGIGRDAPAVDSRSTHHIMGTPPYMAPEIFLRGKYSTATDIYSIGVLLHYLMTGEYPDAFADRTRLLRAKAVPPAFMATIEKALALDPALRQESVREIRHDVGEVLVRPDGLASRRKRRLPALLAGLLLIATASGLVWFLGMDRSSSVVQRLERGAAQVAQHSAGVPASQPGTTDRTITGGLDSAQARLAAPKGPFLRVAQASGHPVPDLLSLPGVASVEPRNGRNGTRPDVIRPRVDTRSPTGAGGSVGTPLPKAALASVNPTVSDRVGPPLVLLPTVVQQLAELRINTGKKAVQRDGSYNAVYNRKTQGRGRTFLNFHMEVTSEGPLKLRSTDLRLEPTGKGGAAYIPFDWFLDLGLVEERGDSLIVPGAGIVQFTAEVPTVDVESLTLVVAGQRVGTVAAIREKIHSRTNGGE